MMHLNSDSLEKLELLDKLLSVVSVGDIKQLCEADLVAAKLKNSPQDVRIIAGILSELKSNETEIAVLRSDYSVLKNDFARLIQAVNQLSVPVPTYSQHLTDLKTKYNAY
jgi:hypothetical protein